MPTLRPAGDHVLLMSLDNGEKVLDSGLIIPGHVERDPEKLRRGEVLAVGPGRWDSSGTKRLPMSVKPGDVVLFSPVFSGQEHLKTIKSPLKSGQVLLRDESIWCVEEEA